MGGNAVGEEGLRLRLCRTVLGRPIQVWALPLDDGLHVLLTGGDLSHVGAVSGAGFPAGRARDVGSAAERGTDAGKTGEGRADAESTGEGGLPAGQPASRPVLPPQTLAFGTHKEGVISEKWAAALAARLSVPCTVACGIHYHHLSQEGIGQVMEACDALLAELLEELGRLNSPDPRSPSHPGR